ncbi:hypothetical protein LO80_09580 [Candidatus Francisella endociliophora]|uniref:Lipoprotein n=1 Tax=Candidatus Francisella endociliophora TaxID=653937 RepID=A0A097ERK5_9GAMM|nr:hypothetical protein [Francisella sp. FSC1006]AIT10194.1 hypothetical protein LO80_09580 [Francisella sp. FSC1006]
MKHKALNIIFLTLVIACTFKTAYSYEFIIKMDPGYREIHTSDALHDISLNTVVDRLPTGSTLKGGSLHNGKGNIWQGHHMNENKKVFDGILTYLHTDNANLDKVHWDRANYQLNITEVGGEGGFGERGSKTHLDLDRVTRDGQKIDICDETFHNTDSLSYAGMGNLTIEFKAEDLDNPHIHITRVHNDGTVDGTWNLCDNR